jgi:hypothetical protein
LASVRDLAGAADFQQTMFHRAPEFGPRAPLFIHRILCSINSGLKTVKNLVADPRQSP